MYQKVRIKCLYKIQDLINLFYLFNIIENWRQTLTLNIFRFNQIIVSVIKGYCGHLLLILFYTVSYLEMAITNIERNKVLYEGSCVVKLYDFRRPIAVT